MVTVGKAKNRLNVRKRSATTVDKKAAKTSFSIKRQDHSRHLHTNNRRPGLRGAIKSSSMAVKMPVSSDERSFQKAMEFLSAQTDYERMRIVRYNTTTFNLDRMRRLLKLLDDPHQKFKSAHIAGTKGKGSTCAMLAAMLQHSGLKVGLYTSPHLVDIRERISINGQLISQADFVKLVRRVEAAIKKMGKDRPTFFEIITAIGFSYFADQQVDFAVIETGLGGRLDSTNVITPEVTGIASISYDHMAVLGSTLPKIAEEKAGIFKKDVPAVASPQPPEVMAVLDRVARQVHAPLAFVGTDIEFSLRFEIARPYGAHVRVTLITPTSRFEHLTVPLIGEHQAVNCGLALAMLDRLKSRGIPVNDAKVAEALSKVELSGRLEMIWRDPRVIIDGAHNAASVQALFKAISQYISYDSMVVIFGCNCDKDIDGMLEQISLGADKVIFTRSANNPKSAVPDELSAAYIERFGKMAQVANSFHEAMEIAGRAITREDLVAVTGSFYLIGEAKQYFMKRSQQPPSMDN